MLNNNHTLAHLEIQDDCHHAKLFNIGSTEEMIQIVFNKSTELLAPDHKLYMYDH
jgi:hypothetical protein